MPNLSLRRLSHRPGGHPTPSARVVSTCASCAPLTRLDLYYYRIPEVKNASPHSPLRFFLGADATLLMFDVNQPATLHGLTR
jgi:hypothetical protein